MVMYSAAGADLLCKRDTYFAKDPIFKRAKRGKIAKRFAQTGSIMNIYQSGYFRGFKELWY